MLELWGIFVILLICPLLGALPLISWITHIWKGREFAQVGVNNISVSAAFYHGGAAVGILAICLESLKGIGVVLLCRLFFPDGSAWELIALSALILGRYSVGQGVGITSVVWGFTFHDPLAAGFLFLVASICFTIVRDRQLAKYGVLALVPVIIGIIHAEDGLRVFAAVAFAALIGWIYQQIPETWTLSSNTTPRENIPDLSPQLRSEQTILSLDDHLDGAIVGQKAARLSQLRRWGYPVPKGWVLSPYDDPEILIEYLQPSELSPLVVRSSAVGEDSDQASSAGQYQTFLNITTKEGLRRAIALVQESYNQPAAIQYRRDRQLHDAAMAVLIQQQVQSVYAGVAFSRDPITQEQDAVVIEAVAGHGTPVVAGRVTPEAYRAFVLDTDNLSLIQLEGKGRVPAALIRQVAYLVRRLEDRHHGIPQDIEWSYDGQMLWVLQTRPISTMSPIWTRKLAAAMVPGLIHPLSWSIHQPMISSVWGELFALLLGERVRGFDFSQGANLYHSRVYCNASLLVQICRRLNLPANSLEFFTQGKDFPVINWDILIRNFPGIQRLFLREFSLEKDFKRDYHRTFATALSQIQQENLEELEPSALLQRIDFICDCIRKITYYQVSAPLSVALRQHLLRVKDGKIDESQIPEEAALRSLQELAMTARELFPDFDPETLFEDLALSVKGQEIIQEFDRLVEQYGYLNEGGINLASPTWKEDKPEVKLLFVQLMQTITPDRGKKIRKKGAVQRRVNLKAQVREIYARLLAELRWTLISLENIWLQTGLLYEEGDIFFLEIEEIRRLVSNYDEELLTQLTDVIQQRRSQFNHDTYLTSVPLLVYGHKPGYFHLSHSPSTEKTLQGIPVSSGKTTGKVKILQSLQNLPEIDPDTIVVVPYADYGWAAHLIRAKGIIAEVGGKLSHLAILAREYNIPAVMDIHHATHILKDGQVVTIDGFRGVVEILD